MFRHGYLVLVLFALTLLQGCGGGGGGGSTGDDPRSSAFGQLVWGADTWQNSK